MKKVYIACPLFHGSPTYDELQRRIMSTYPAHLRLVKAGYVVFNPAFSCFIDIQDEMRSTWLEIDQELIRLSDIVYRYPGESQGADRDVEYAQSLGKEIIYDLDSYLGKEQ